MGLSLSRLAAMMLHFVAVKIAVLVGLTGCKRQAALDTQDLSCTCLAQHELESGNILLISNAVGLVSCSTVQNDASPLPQVSSRLQSSVVRTLPRQRTTLQCAVC